MLFTAYAHTGVQPTQTPLWQIKACTSMAPSPHTVTYRPAGTEELDHHWELHYSCILIATIKIGVCDHVHI